MSGNSISKGMSSDWLKKTIDPNEGEFYSAIDQLIDLGGLDGLFCTDVREPVPKFRNAQCEVIHEGKNNSFIVLGRDRPSNLGTGCGGSGYIQAGMIDLVAGRYALNSAEELKKDKPPVGQEEKVDPNFITDAARVYITQKCLNIDQYFGLDNTTTSKSRLEETSAVGIKADHVRIIGRDTVRIYAGTAQNVEGLSKNRETNSRGGELLPGKGKIELVAGNGLESNLQPAVLGNNLIDYLKDLEEEISAIKTDISFVMENLIAINSVLAAMTLGAPPYSINLKGNVEKYVEQITGKINSELRRLRALNELGCVLGDKSVVSSNVFVS
jgi:hypothetical protein